MRKKTSANKKPMSPKKKKVLRILLAIAFTGFLTCVIIGVNILGTSADYAPFEFMYPNDEGEMVYGGIDVFVAEYLAEATGKELVIENM